MAVAYRLSAGQAAGLPAVFVRYDAKVDPLKLQRKSDLVRAGSFNPHILMIHG